MPWLAQGKLSSLVYLQSRTGCLKHFLPREVLFPCLNEIGRSLLLTNDFQVGTCCQPNSSRLLAGQMLLWCHSISCTSFPFSIVHIRPQYCKEFPWFKKNAQLVVGKALPTLGPITNTVLQICTVYVNCTVFLSTIWYFQISSKKLSTCISKWWPFWAFQAKTDILLSKLSWMPHPFSFCHFKAAHPFFTLHSMKSSQQYLLAVGQEIPNQKCVQVDRRWLITQIAPGI